MRPFAGGLIELRCSGIKQLDDAELRMVDFLRASSSGGLLRNRSRLGDRVVVLQYHHPIFMVLIGGFPLDIPEVYEPVECHGKPPSFFSVTIVCQPSTTFLCGERHPGAATRVATRDR